MTSVSMRVDMAGDDGIPHTFLVVTHPDGQVLEYGLTPKVTGLSGPGEVKITGKQSPIGDDHEYKYQGPTEQVSDAQYQRLMDNIHRSMANPPYYVVSGTWTPGQGTNCTGWAIGMWQDAGLPNTLGVTNAWVWNPYGQGMNLAIANLTNSLIVDLQRKFVLAEQTVSPLVLDLDGDGIETTALSKSFSAGTHFDLDAQGLAENTSWVASDDGLLVLDRNGNGQVDNGRELFGNHTPLANGQEAANGFAALAELDSNRNNTIDAQDALYAQLQIWQDRNQDGRVQTGELSTLVQAGIKSLNLAYSNSNQTDSNGNAHRQLGSYTTTAGQSHSMHDVWFQVDAVRAADISPLPLSAAIAALPDAPGMGNVSSLRQAVLHKSSYVC